MSIRRVLLALGGAAMTAAVLTALTVPLARSSGLEGPTTSGAERVVGVTLSTTAILLFLHTPVIALLERTQPRLDRAWVAIGSVVLVFLLFMLFPIIETGSLMPLVWNVQGWLQRPLWFVADQLPFYAPVAVYATIAWTSTATGTATRDN